MELEHLYSEDAVPFPESLSSSYPDAVFRLCSAINEGGETVVLDASDLKFIDPFGLATLRATLESQPGGKKFFVRYMTAEMLSYLIQMHFFEGLEVEGIDKEIAENRGLGQANHCVQLMKVSEGNSEQIASRLVYAMTGESGEQGGSRFDDCIHPIEYALKELLENALSHAKKDGNGNASVWVACQHFEDDVVRLAIVDNGCGFLATLRGHQQLAEETDLAAIDAALTERVSCNRGPLVGYETDSQNQGVGLTTTARIAQAANGFLVVASGNAWIRTTVDLRKQLDDAHWKGVAIAFNCQRDQLPNVSIAALLPAVEGIADNDISFE